MSESDQAPPQLPTCSNCGAPVPHSQSYCPKCGYSRLAPGRRSGSNSCLQALLVLVFLAIVLPVAAVGACFLLLSQGDGATIAMGIGAILLAILVLVLMVRAVMKS